MRSYYKIYRKIVNVDPPASGTRIVHYEHDPGGEREVLAVEMMNKADFVGMLNYCGGTFIALKYIGNDPNAGQNATPPFGTTNLYPPAAPWFTFVPYEEHPLN